MGEQTRCSYCRRILRSTLPGRPTRMLTKDHILPRAWGRGMTGVRNTRLACQRCNRLRADVGHCPAALALVLQFTPLRGGSNQRAARYLRVWAPGGGHA